MLLSKKYLLKALRIYVVEDEPLILATITTALAKQGFKVVGDSDNIKKAMLEIQQLAPDLVLIDIQLNGIEDGIDLALHLDQTHIPYLYLTAQTDPETIQRVKRTSPLGYIVKPFTENGLRSNIELAWHNFSLTNEKFLLIKSEGRLYKVNQKNVLYLKAFDNYCYVITLQKEYLIPHTLKYALEKLSDKYFVKTHRSYAINLAHVTIIEKSKIFIGTTEIPLSNSHKSSLKSKIDAL